MGVSRHPEPFTSSFHSKFVKQAVYVSKRGIGLLFLCIVFQGELYEAVLQRGKVRLRPASRLLLRLNHHDRPDMEHRESW
jgi:hypothetical protein